MNIAEATVQIEGAIKAYLAQDETGLDLIPPQMQRPILMMGPPGIGKTAIVGQIAERMGINFVSYSITHHTRQSALGLPFIAEASFGGKTYRVSRYTMSEIIATVHDAIEDSQVHEGILFLDEVNCASETLMPSMLQFLQYKSFGPHRLPTGWVIVCAGNPPEYNRAAREFDPAMTDRLKRIDIEPDLDAWMDYATTQAVHPAITSYLANKPKNFYKVRTGVHGARMVTARGWEDLSRMMRACRHEGIAVNQNLVSQYLQDREVAEDFSLYLELFSKYEDDYKIQDILAGTAKGEISRRAKEAAFDERIALVNLLLNALLDEVHELDGATRALRGARKTVDDITEQASHEWARRLDERAQKRREHSEEARAKGTASEARLRELVGEARLLDALRRTLLQSTELGAKGSKDARVLCSEVLDAQESSLATHASRISSEVERVLDFLDGCFGDGQEMLVFTTHLAVDPAFMRLASTHGAASFTRHSRALMLHERGLDLLDTADRLVERGAGATGVANRREPSRPPSK